MSCFKNDFKHYIVLKINMDITPLLPYLSSTSNLALSCRDFTWRVRSNGFPIRTSKREVCIENLQFYRYLGCPNLNELLSDQVFRAIENDKPECLHLLLQAGADIEAKNNDRETALSFAAYCGRTDCLKLLLESGADIEARDCYRRTALLLAVRYGKADCIKLLLERGANPEATDNLWGYTALIWAAWSGQTDCIKLLLECGVKVTPELRERYPKYAAYWEKFIL